MLLHYQLLTDLQGHLAILAVGFNREHVIKLSLHANKSQTNS